MILVTGGLGFVGSHTCAALLDAGLGCVATRHRRSDFGLASPATSAELVVEELDVTDWDRWHALRPGHRITGIIHLAAVGVDQPPLEQLAANFEGLINVIRAAQEWEVGRVVVASTIGVYAGVDTSAPLGEDLGLPPIGLHGIQASKKIAEITGDLITRSGGPQIVAARLPAVWGPLGNPASRFFTLPRLVHSAVAGQPAASVAGEAIDAMYAADVGRALVALVTSDRLSHTVYNVGSGHATSNTEVAAAIRGQIPDARITLDEAGTAAPPVVLDITRLTEDTDFEPQFTLAAGVAEYIEWLRAGHAK